MDTLLNKLGDKVKGVLEGFDRIVFKGILKHLCYIAGMQMYLINNGVLNKDYKDWVVEKSTQIIRDAEEYVHNQCGTNIQYLPSSNIRTAPVSASLVFAACIAVCAAASEDKNPISATLATLSHHGSFSFSVL